MQKYAIENIDLQLHLFIHRWLVWKGENPDMYEQFDKEENCINNGDYDENGSSFLSENHPINGD